jgi:16S rRNA (cytosine1402-N4)-methyltransferase
MSFQDPPGPSPKSVEPEDGHVPVMVEEVMAALSPVAGGLHIDATLGGGGHARRILAATSPDGRLLGLDADRAAIAKAAVRLAEFGQRAVLRQANFEQLGDVARSTNMTPVDGVLFDLGLSSDQLADDERGFSFRANGPLDMRFDTTRGEPAAQVLAELSERELRDLFRRYGEEPFAGRIARAIVEQRGHASIETAHQLAALVEHSVPSDARRRRRIHPATRVFQALRIYVNRELETLPLALAEALAVLRPGGRLAVISYHSLEDRIVKRFISSERRGCTCPPELPVCVCGRSATLAPVGRQPQRPTTAEVASNPRSRSALLRAARRLAA